MSSHDRMTPEAKAYAAVSRAVEEIPQAAQIRVLEHAREVAMGGSNYLDIAKQVTDMLADLVDSVRAAVKNCQTCQGTRLADGKPCPICFSLWEILPEAQRRAELLRGAESLNSPSNGDSSHG